MNVVLLSLRALSRATLTRQLLDERRELAARAAIEHLVGLQAQEPLAPYTGLWSRLVEFDPTELADLVTSRTVVRIHLMRRTVHLVSGDDCRRLRTLHDPMLHQRLLGVRRRQLAGIDLDALGAAGREVLGGEGLTLPDAGRALADRWPNAEPGALGDGLTVALPLVQVPPRGVWGQKGPARHVPADVWLEGELHDVGPDTAETLVLRYLTAFGPAATADVRAWSGLTGLPEVIQRLKPRLRTFTDDRGRDLIDVLDAPLPDEDMPVPPRFLPAFDNAVLGYDDRRRIIDDEHRHLSVAGSRFLLVDGRVAGVWKTEPATDRRSGALTLIVETFGPLSRTDRSAVIAEGHQLVGFLAGESGGASGADRKVVVRRA